MKKLALILGMLFATQTLCANEEQAPETKPNEVHQSYGYYSFSGGFPSIFSFDVGTRIQHNHHAFDGGIGVTPLLVIIEGHAYANYLFYPNPNPKSQIYMGLGAKGGYGAFVHHWKGLAYVQPQLIFGKEYRRTDGELRFIQANLAPAYITNKGSEFVPSLMITYGIGF